MSVCGVGMLLSLMRVMLWKVHRQTRRGRLTFGVLVYVPVI